VRCPVVQMVEQRHDTDCGVAVLAMMLTVSYEEALMAIGPEKPTVLIKGVWMPELTRAAQALGTTLRHRDSWDYANDDGIVRVSNKTWAHVVLLRGGLFWNTDRTVWRPDDYLKAKRVKARSILVREDG
jgi:hypothetical protein